MVHLVVRMHDAPGAARPAEELARAIGDDLVHVHIGGGPCPTLEDIDREFRIVLSNDHLAARRDDRVALLGRETAFVAIRLSGGDLHLRQRLQEKRQPSHRHARDREVRNRAGRLRAESAPPAH